MNNTTIKIDNTTYRVKRVFIREDKRLNLLEDCIIKRAAEKTDFDARPRIDI